MDIRIRAGHANGPDLDFAEAVRLAMGTNERVAHIYVTPVHEQDDGSGRYAVKAGEAVFGLDAEVVARRIRYGDNTDATVTVGGSGQHTPAEAQAHIAAYTLGAQIAAAANAAAAAAREAAPRCLNTWRTFRINEDLL